MLGADVSEHLADFLVFRVPTFSVLGLEKVVFAVVDDFRGPRSTCEKQSYRNDQ